MKLLKKIVVVVTLVLSVFMTRIASSADKYDIDPAHSTIGFAVKHLMVSVVRGGFNEFNGSIDFDSKDPSAFKADLTIQTQSINTNVSKRDTHLKSPDFFNADKFPTITFASKKLTPQSSGYAITGDLTMHGVTKEITIPVSISGPIKSPFGTQVIGLSGEITINRQDYGVSWSKNLDSGGLVVDDNVKVIVEIEADKK